MEEERFAYFFGIYRKIWTYKSIDPNTLDSVEVAS